MKQHSPRHWFLVALSGAAALAVVHGLGRFAFTPMVPVMQAQADLDIPAAAALASVNYLAYLLGSLFTLWKHTPEDRGRWLLLGLWLNVATTAAMGLTAQPQLWILLRFANGFSNGLVFVYAPAVVLDYLMRRGRGVWSGLSFTGVGAGIVLSSLLVMAGDTLHADWRLLWLLLGLLAAPLAWLAARNLRLPPGPPHPRAPRTAGDYAGLSWLVAGYSCAGFGYIISMTFLPVIIKADPALQAWADLSWLLVGVAAAPSAFLWSWLGQRLGDPRALLAAYLLQALGVVLPVWLPTAAGAVLGAVAVGGTFIGIVLLTMRIARRRWPADAGRLIGLLVTCYGVAQMLGPLLAGWTVQRWGSFAPALELAGASLLLGTVLMHLAGRRSAAAEGRSDLSH